ncbi:MAG: hypothetical protein HZC40_04525 [Chloroflexi bacterium]|nr:hypothetical protein [Chloroflexota bacterium]
MLIVEPAFTLLYPQSKSEAVEPLRRVELAGRVCYKSDDRVTDDSYLRFIQMLMQDWFAPMIPTIAAPQKTRTIDPLELGWLAIAILVLALQQGLKMGIVEYRLLVFEK